MWHHEKPLGLFFFAALTLSSLHFNSEAADVPRLTQLFTENFHAFYEPRQCGNNIQQLVQKAFDEQVDLSNSYVLNFEGAGFLETSGFYTRERPGQRAMLGYFHFVLVADGMVFDFDLYEPLVLSLEDYVRLQLTPVVNPSPVMGIHYDAAKELRHWKAIKYHPLALIHRHSSDALWSGKFSELVDVNAATQRTRVRPAN